MFNRCCNRIVTGQVFYTRVVRVNCFHIDSVKSQVTSTMFQKDDHP
jgi:hypothetical protein